MFRIIVFKELKSILLSPKFAATFGVCSLLLLLSVYIGINEYHASVRRYDTAGELIEQQVREARSWHQSNLSLTKPDASVCRRREQ